jgi:hypothetical protein
MMNYSYITAPRALMYGPRTKASGVLRKHRLPVLLIFLHAPLGLVLMQNANLAAVHAYVVLLLGLYWALNRNKRLEDIGALVAYLVSSEVLWRMAEAPVFWEFGKYAAGMIMISALAARNKWKIPSLPMLYFLFLLPACFLTVIADGFGDAKEKLSFNISGPLLLLISCWYFSHNRLNWLQVRKVLFWLLVPLVSVGITTLFFTVTAEKIRFTDESNRATSGGFGPNQVSAMLGLGVFICIACYLLFKNRSKEKLLLAFLAIFLAAQSVMTFSRGGIYNAAGATLVVLLFQMNNVGKGLKKIIAVGSIAAIFMLAIFPQMNDFTGGTLGARFESTETTGRFEIAEADLMIFMENPVWGAGVGEAFEYRAKFFKHMVAAHTEFSRMVAEHGVFGIFSLLALGLAASFAFWRQKTDLGRSIAAGFITWSVLFMFNTGMRLVAPSFIWGLSFIVLTNYPLGRRGRSIRFRPSGIAKDQ